VARLDIVWGVFVYVTQKNSRLANFEGLAFGAYLSVIRVLRSGKRRTLNLQNRQYSPKFAIYGYKDDKPQQLREVYVYFEEKYQH